MKRLARVLVLLVGGPVVVAFTALPASAEWFIDLYAGSAFPQDVDLTLRAGGDSETTRLTFDTAVTGGGRVGLWYSQAPWVGLALDGSYFRADYKPKDVAPGEEVAKGKLDIVPISLLVMVRRPDGALQPYAGIGPAMFISTIRIPTVVEADGQVVEASVKDTSLEFGLDVRAGVAWRFHENAAIFVEYRFTHVRVTGEDRILGQTVRAETEHLQTHAVLGGISLRFP